MVRIKADFVFISCVVGNANKSRNLKFLCDLNLPWVKYFETLDIPY